MFRYNRKAKTINDGVAPTNYVTGWRESQLLRTLKYSQKRKFEIELASGVMVEVDIHFFESFMQSLSQTGFLETGVGGEPITGGDSIIKETALPMIQYLKIHHDKTTYKLPEGSLDLLMGFISKGTEMYELINQFETENELVVMELLEEKKAYRVETLEKNNQLQLQNKTDIMQSRIENIEEHYNSIISAATKNKRLGLAKDMVDKVMPKKIEMVLDRYGEEVEKITKDKSKSLTSILQYNYLTYSFFISEFDLLVAKIGDKKLRIRTIYDITDAGEPKNTLLYIPHYGDIVDLQKV